MNNPLVGLSIWDMSGWDGQEKYSPAYKEFHETVLTEKLHHYNRHFTVAELAQDADYLNRDLNCWSNIDLINTPGFITFALTTARIAVHLRHRHVDIAESENNTHRKWSLEQVKEGVRFAFRIGADHGILHPGTQNERSGHFWPSASDLPGILENRGAALDNSLAEIAAVIAEEAFQREERLHCFEQSNRGVFNELSSILKELSLSPRGEERIRHLARAIDIVERGKLTLEQIRHCVSPWAGLHIAVENLEPPNFLVCSPAQISSIHRKFTVYCREAASTKGLSQAAIERYLPGIALDPGHLLNSKIILTLDQNRQFLEAIDGADEFFGDFVQLPGQYNRQGNSDVLSEPILNRFVRKNCEHIMWCYIHGCRRTDTMMTSHEPVRTFRKAHYLERDGRGKVQNLYLMNSFSPDDELNLNEVVQVLGMDIPYIAEIIGAPIEVVISSANNLKHYLSFLWRERSLALSAVKNAISQEAKIASPDNDSRKEHLEWLGKALSKSRFYVRNKPSELGMLTAGYDEAGFYIYSDDDCKGNVDIFATVKQTTGKVWLQGINGER